jgi:ribosomal protein L32
MLTLFKKIISPTTVNKVTSLAPLGSNLGIRSFHTSNFLAAVPKKRVSHRRKRIKWKNRMFMKPPTHNHACTNCGTWTANYNICDACGWYDGKPVTKKARAKHEEAKTTANADGSAVPATTQTPSS